MDRYCYECDDQHRYACPKEVMRNREARVKERQQRLDAARK